MSEKLINQIVPFESRYKYITGTEIASVVKHYKKHDFQTFFDINYIFSRKKWSSEDREKINSLFQENNKFLFNKGKEFEKRIKIKLSDSFQDKVLSYCDSQDTIADEALHISATPDFIVEEGTTKKLIETKIGSSSTNNLMQYKYQIAMQALLIPNFDISKEGHDAYIFFKTDYEKDETNYKAFKLDTEEILTMQAEILECSKLFWQDFENNNFALITADQHLNSLQTIEEEITDISLLNKINRFYLWHSQKKEMDSIKQEINDTFQGKCDKAFASCEDAIIQLTFVKEKKVELKEDYYSKEIAKKQEEIAKLQVELDSLKNGNEPKTKRTAGSFRIIERSSV